MMCFYCLALEKGNLLTRKWFILNNRYIAWLDKARPVFSVDFGLYTAICSDLLKRILSYVLFLILTSYMCVRSNLEWLFIEGKYVIKSILLYFTMFCSVLLDRTKIFQPSFYLILNDTFRIIGIAYHEFIQESFYILRKCQRIGFLDLCTAHNKIFSIVQKKLLLYANIIVKIGLTTTSKVNLILITHLVSRTRFLNLLCLIETSYNPIWIRLLDLLTLEIKTINTMFLYVPTFIRSMNTQIQILIKHLKTSNLSIENLDNSISRKLHTIHIYILSKYLKFVLKSLRSYTLIIRSCLKTKDFLIEFINIELPTIKQYIEIKIAILIYCLNDNNQALVKFLKKIPAVKAKGKYRHITDPGIIDFVSSIDQIKISTINFIIENSLVFIEFIKSKTRLIIRSITFDIPIVKQFIIVDTPTTIEFIKVKLPGIENLLIEQTSLRAKRELFQKNSLFIGVIIIILKVFSFRFIYKTLLDMYLLILLAEIYLVLGDQSALIFAVNSIAYISIPIKLLFIIVKVSFYFIDLICEILAIYSFLFVGTSLAVFIIEPYVVYTLGLKYAPEIIKLPAYRIFIKHLTFYYADYLGFFKTFPINDINGIIKNN